ncbi:MAG: RHS repeat-associated core domain-containing protein [Planctomycetota bacterium]
MIHYEYDEASSRLTRTYTGLADTADNSIDDDGKAVSDTRYEYDAFGRLWKVIVTERNDDRIEDPEDFEVTTYRYDKVGNLDRTDQANGVIIDYVYDDLNRLDLLTHYASDANNEDLSDNDVLSRFDYKVGTDGNRTGVVETNENGHITEVDWFYDEIGRLTREVHDSFDDDLDYAAGYDYDFVGNRIVQWVDEDIDGGVDRRTVYEYDANDRLRYEKIDEDGVFSSVDKTIAYEYGPGNARTEQTTKTLRNVTNTVGAWLSQTTQTFDVRGRLVKVEIDSDGDEDADTTIDYVYNADGNRVEQTVTDHGTSTTETTTYLVDANNHTGFSQVIEEYLDSVLVKSFVLGHDVIAQAGPAAMPIYFLLYDGHGSTRALTNETGALVARQVYAYDAYGKAVVFETEDALTTLLYSGEQTDSLTGMQYLRARYYDPSTGRFASLDPFAGNNQDPVSLHKYAYATPNPIMFIDPAGLFTQAQGYLAEEEIAKIYTRDHLADITKTKAVEGQIVPGVVFGRWARVGANIRLKPDITNHIQEKYNEIKPFTISGVASAVDALKRYLPNYTSEGYTIDASWTPSVRLIYIPCRL